jgi:hypothetical protein
LGFGLRRAPARLTAALALLTLCGACSIFASGTNLISITTNPSGAEVMVNGANVGVSPITYTAKSSDDLEILVTKPGYMPRRASTGTGLTTCGALDAIGACIWLVPLMGLFFPGAWSQEQSIFDITLAPLES